MKQFYFYTLKQEYVDKYETIEPELANMKATKRPFICIKYNDKNWLVPIASISGNHSALNSSKQRYLSYLNLDMQQATYL